MLNMKPDRVNLYGPREVSSQRGSSTSSSSQKSYQYPLQDAMAEGLSELGKIERVLPAAALQDPDSIPVILSNIRQMQGYLGGLPSALPSKRVTSESGSSSSSGPSTTWTRKDLGSLKPEYAPYEE